jgi:hypothetical protein
MKPPIQQGIESLYAAFATVPRPRHIAGCACCVDEKGVDVLLSKPLRELTPDELSAYAASVFLTVGSEADFRYFLPRILEIAVGEPGWWPDWEVVGRALADSRWQEWTASEKAAVVTLLDAEFAECCERKSPLNEGLDGSRIDGFLCCLSRSGLDIGPYLTRLASKPAAVLAMFDWNSQHILQRRLTNQFWEDDHAGAARVLAWFYSPEISGQIKEAYGLDLIALSAKPTP